MNTTDITNLILKQLSSILMPILFIILILTIINEMFLKNSKEKKYEFNKRNKMSIKTPTEIGKEINKKAKEINQHLLEIGFIEDSIQGWKITEKGKKAGGIQKNYKGNLSVHWDDKILTNKIFINTINYDEEIKNKDEIDFRNKFKADYRTKSGHFVRSRAEVIIANWLYSELICFAYERRVPIEDDMYCDFYIPKYKIYIEFWGYEEDKKYINRKNKKLKIYKKEQLNLIQIDNKTINNLDDYLPKELLKFGLKI